MIETEESDVNEQLLEILPMKATESYYDVKVNECLTVEQTGIVISLLHEFQELIDLLGRTDVIQHEGN